MAASLLQMRAEDATFDAVIVRFSTTRMNTALLLLEVQPCIFQEITAQHHHQDLS